MVYPITKRVIPAIMKLWTKKVIGVENLPKDNFGFIVAANHGSYLDHFFLGSLITPKLNRVMHFIAKKEHFDSFIQRTWHNYLQAIPIDREAGGEDALKHAVEALKNGEIIAIYPEGTRTRTGEIQRGKTGVARLLLAAKVPVLPVGINGSFEILPKGKWIPRLKRATVTIGKLMYFEKYYGKQNDKKVIREVTDDIMKDIARLAGKRYEG
ncbi:MAG: 1-acyl-sn-glycerol-3-phosphate acyltransferase [Nanoarchaeota archaeon]|nr:1-acyl-sn-glycerol-3-phosphate acyltransferase [Nanoarchaeota archaeon]MBU1704848.1 1-acyl-sn-glycerol-3-phosphate acyltransferase [Nanoarchaeota archaeon]